MHPLVFIGLAIAAFGVVCDMADDFDLSSLRRDTPQMRIMSASEFEELVRSMQERE